MPILRRCERCGAELALGALAELCPQCLLWSAAQGSTADQSGPTHAGMDSSTFAGEADGEAPRVEGYVPIAPLGRGGMGVVWRALQVGTRREVALKLLRPDVVHSDRARRRFAREVELAARLEHPNIARVYDGGICRGVPYYVMELVGGSTLDRYAAEVAPSRRQVLELVAQVGRAIGYAHDRGVVHRDIKPANILIGLDGQPHVLDFGLATACGAAAQPSAASTDGEVIGTPAFMAPEQADGSRTGIGTDVYGLGATLYYVLTGKPPHDLSGSREEVYQKIRSGEVRPLGDACPGLEKDLEAVLLKALAPEPGQRHRSVREFVEEVEGCLDAGSIGPAAATSEEVPPNNLPGRLTSFIGRRKEMGEISRRLAGSDRLLTLVGPGGSGKTRLALEVAAQSLATHRDGVWWVELAPLADGALVARRVAHVLGVTEEPGKPVAQAIADQVGRKAALLVLDNCERLLDACARLGHALMLACPNLRIVATSRQRLGIDGETTLEVRGLSLPDEAPQGRRAKAGAPESVRLFIDRAKRAAPGVKLSASDGLVLAAVCRRLDGLPLAIELAAARLRTLSLQELRDRLDDRFGLLTGGSRIAAPAEQTLEATINWSYALLGEAERAVLRRCSAFAGGWDVAAAESVCAGDGVDAGAVLEIHSKLVEKSLVARDPVRDRYRVPETVRAYGRRQLVALGEGEAVEVRHRDYFLLLAEQQSEVLTSGLVGPAGAGWLEVLEADHDNLRAALAFCAGRADSAQPALRIVAALGRFWSIRGHVFEGRGHTGDALRRAGDGAPQPLRARALRWAAHLAAIQDDWQAARKTAEQCLALARACGERRTMAGALGTLGHVALAQGRCADARSLSERCAVLCREHGEEPGAAAILVDVGGRTFWQRDEAAARSSSEKAGEIFGRNSYALGVAAALVGLAEVALARGDYGAAAGLYERARAMPVPLSFRAACAEGRAMVHWREGEVAAARAGFAQGLASCRDLGDRAGVCRNLKMLACLAAADGRSASAAQLFGAAEALVEAIRAPVRQVGWYDVAPEVERVRRAMGVGRFAAEWAVGRGMAIEAAIDLALGDARAEV